MLLMVLSRIECVRGEYLTRDEWFSFLKINNNGGSAAHMSWLHVIHSANANEERWEKFSICHVSCYFRWQLIVSNKSCQRNRQFMRFNNINIPGCQEHSRGKRAEKQIIRLDPNTHTQTHTKYNIMMTATNSKGRCVVIIIQVFSSSILCLVRLFVFAECSNLLRLI